jgi:putative addiction module killer protein
MPFSDWLASLRDKRTVAILRARLNRIRLGNFGDARPVGEGVQELRINWGPGYRVYFGRESQTVAVLLCGGSKKTQRRDIALAKEYWRDYLYGED